MTGPTLMLSNAEILAASILIVDDQAANVRLLENLLSSAGYTNISATMIPQDVPELHRLNRYDLILLDLQMPGMDGFEVMECLKSGATDSYLPVIVLTAHSALKLTALQAGAKDFISKPFDLIEVTTRIHNMLEVRLLHKKLQSYNEVLERTVCQRTAELCESEDRFRRLAELASDWYWEQNASGDFIRISGPVLESLGISVGAAVADQADGWNPEERRQLRAKIAARQPFLDFAFTRIDANGSRHNFRVSGEPIFNQSCRFVGYRGIGVEILDGYA